VRTITTKRPAHSQSKTPGGAAPESAVIVVTDGSLSVRSYRRFSEDLQSRLALPVRELRVTSQPLDSASELAAAIDAVLADLESVHTLGLVAHADGVNAVLRAGLAALPGNRSVVRIALVVPPDSLGQAVGSPGVPVLVQVSRPTDRHHPIVSLASEWTASGTATRVAEYPGTARDWIRQPRRVKGSVERMDALAAFLARGLVNDGFDVIPAWNLS
jgi:hypothetical protein